MWKDVRLSSTENKETEECLEKISETWLNIALETIQEKYETLPKRLKVFNKMNAFMNRFQFIRYVFCSI